MQTKSNMKVFIAPGGSGDPNTPKLRCLESVAKKLGIDYILPDWRGVARDPEVRLKLLEQSGILEADQIVLAGTSLGGYVSLIAAEQTDVDGLFLLVPILGPDRSTVSAPVPRSKETLIFHSINDEYTSSDNVQQYARDIGAQLHLLDGAHSLEGHLALIEKEFKSFIKKRACRV